MFCRQGAGLSILLTRAKKFRWDFRSTDSIFRASHVTGNVPVDAESKARAGCLFRETRCALDAAVCKVRCGGAV